MGKGKSISEVSTPAQRVAVYCRANGSDAHHDCETQKAHCIRQISEHPGWDLAEVFTDEGLPCSRRRPAFEEMLRQCAAGCFDVILTKNISRLDRIVAECLKHINVLKGCGVEVYFEAEKLSTSDPGFDEQTIAYELIREIAVEEAERIVTLPGLCSYTAADWDRYLAPRKEHDRRKER